MDTGYRNIYCIILIVAPFFRRQLNTMYIFRSFIHTVRTGLKHDPDAGISSFK